MTVHKVSYQKAGSSRVFLADIVCLEQMNYRELTKHIKKTITEKFGEVHSIKYLKQY